MLKLSKVGRLGAIGGALLSIGVFSTMVSAQDAGFSVSVPSVTETEYPNAQAVVNTEDTTGSSLTGLDASNFTVTVDGKPTTVSAAELASSTTSPLDVLLLMDTSGSTKGEALAQTKAAAIAFINSLAPEDRVAVMRFANSVTLQQDYTSDKAAAIAAINALESKGQTELYKATDAAVRQAATSTSSRRAMILLTDGAGDAIVTDVTETGALASARDSGVPVFTIAQGAAVLDPRFLVDLADISNGRYLEAATPGDLTGVYQSIGRLLQNQYVVTFDASEAAGKPEAPISVQVTAGGRSGSAEGVFVPGPAFIAPAVTITGLTAGESLTEPRDVVVAASGTQPVTKAAFYVDGVNVFETTDAPFTFSYDPNKFGDSEHTLRVAVTVGEKLVDSEPIAFTSVPSEPVPTAIENDGGGGGLPIVPIAGGFGLLALLGIAFLVVQRIKQTSGPVLTIASPDQRVTPWTGRHRNLGKVADVDGDEASIADGPVSEDIGEALGVLVSRAGSDLGSEYAVGEKPVSIGNGTKCAVHIDDPTLASEEARIWIRKGNLMLHKMTRLTTIASEGNAGGWVMLEPGEQFTIGSHVFEFRLLPEGAPVPETVVQKAPESPAPDILRDKPAPAGPLPAPGMASSDEPAQPQQPRRLTEMMPRDMGFSGQDMDGQAEQAEAS